MVVLETLDAVSSSQFSASLEAKLDKSAGSANSGAFMVVNSSGNIVPEQKTFVTPTALASDLAGKVNVAQGASNANKFLVTDQDGNVIAEAKSLPSREDVDAIVTISSQQPTSDGAKIWINDSNAESAVLVPTTQEMNDALAEKLNANLGAENAGQYLMVDSDGDVVGVFCNLATAAEVNEIANAKVSEYQGQQNAGRFLAVGNDGNIELVVTDTVSSSELSDSLANYAMLTSPHFNGTPTAPTANVGDASTQIASTAFVANAVNAALSSVYVLMGTKESVAALPQTGNEIGHVWHVNADGNNYFWDGSAWQSMGNAVDLSGKLDANLTPANAGKFLKVDTNGDVQPVTLDVVSTGAVNTALAGKVDVAQPNANAGDLLAVDSTGKVTAQTIPYATQAYADGIIKAGSSEPTDAQTKLWINTSDVEGEAVYTQDEIDAALDNKVDKETGKGLSTNDFTDAYLDRLLSVANGAQVNVIETIKLNGSTLSPDTNKTVNITTPVPDTMTSDEAKTGTSTTAKLVSAKTLNDAITNKGYTQNVGTVTGVKMNNGTALTPDTNGVVDLGSVITAHQDITGKQDKNLGKSNAKKLLTVNSSGNIAASTITTDNISALTSTVNGKVDVSQGAANAGKFMVVGSDGNLAATSISRAIIECENGTWSIARSASGAPTINVDVGQATSGDIFVPTTTQMQTGLAAKLNNNFGASEAGKFLVVGSDGQITAVTMQQWQAGSY